MTEEITDAELIDTGTDIVSYRPTMVMTATEAVEQATQLREAITHVLKPDIDYGVIPGTKKPSLLKPGAEWLLKLFGFGHNFELLETETDENGIKRGVVYRCIITRPLPDGPVITVATCDGHASRDEKKWAFAPWNTIIKMAQKRAMVGAALQATGTSGSFTQDMEDIVQSGPSIVSLSKFIKELPDDAVSIARATWKENGWPPVDQVNVPLALEIVFFLGELSACLVSDMEEIKTEATKRVAAFLNVHGV